MINLTRIRTLTLLTGLVIAGEALALVVGMRVLSPGDNPWVSLKSDQSWYSRMYPLSPPPRPWM